MSLYTFQTVDPTASLMYGAPRLIPAGIISGPGANNIAMDSPSFGMIDVINKFQWTTSPPSSRQRVPAILLKEKRLKNNALYAQVAYYGLALGQSIGGGLGGLTALPEPIRTIAQSVVGGFTATKIFEVGRAIANAVGLGSSGGGVISNLFQSAVALGGAIYGGTRTEEEIRAGFNTLASLGQIAGRDLPSQFNIEALNSRVLAPYEGLYITEDTKFVYNFPYFSDEQNYISNMFGDYDDVFGLGGLDPLGAASLASSTRDASMFVSGIVNFDAPGIYIEKPKFFNFKEQGEQLRFRFPLINTGWSTFEDVKRNWQLMYLIAYQNRPNRRTRNLIDPAVLYEITIPGVRYYPFSYISELAINFVGARRRMELNVPVVGGSRTITTIVPDAYIIDITLTTLVSESQNFLYALLHDKQEIITTSTTRSPFDILANEGVNALTNAYLQNLNPTTQTGANAGLSEINNLVDKIYRNAAGGSQINNGSTR